MEFVSANPTGPPHAGHARNAAYGDSLGRVLSLHGHAVTREYYVNDFGSQVVRFGESIQARARGEEVPEDGYQGDYVKELAGEFRRGRDRRRPRRLPRRRGHHAGPRTGEPARLRHRLRRLVLGGLAARGLSSAAVDRAFAQLEAQGHTYRSEGALWLRTTAFGDDKDRVLERSSGEHTYSRRTSPTTRRSAGRGFDGSSTCGGPTTTATCGG